LALPENVDFTRAWSQISAQLRRVVGDSTFEIWLSSLQALDWDGRTLVLRGQIDTQTWVAERFGRLIETCAASVLGTDLQIRFDGGPGPMTPRGASAARSGGRRRAADPAPTPDAGDGFNPRYSFDQFVIGPGNRLAHAASLAVSELPGHAYNPLFLHAPPGLGKTHLLHAIGNYVLAFGGGTTVRYATVESFTNHFINALSTRSVDSFKRAYRDADGQQPEGKPDRQQLGEQTAQHRSDGISAPGDHPASGVDTGLQMIPIFPSCGSRATNCLPGRRCGSPTRWSIPHIRCPFRVEQDVCRHLQRAGFWQPPSRGAQPRHLRDGRARRRYPA